MGLGAGYWVLGKFAVIVPIEKFDRWTSQFLQTDSVMCLDEARDLLHAPAPVFRTRVWENHTSTAESKTSEVFRVCVVVVEQS